MLERKVRLSILYIEYSANSVDTMYTPNIHLMNNAGFRTNGESCGECTDDEDFLARNGLGKKASMQTFEKN